MITGNSGREHLPEQLVSGLVAVAVTVARRLLPRLQLERLDLAMIRRELGHLLPWLRRKGPALPLWNWPGANASNCYRSPRFLQLSTFSSGYCTPGSPLNREAGTVFLGVPVGRATCRGMRFIEQRGDLAEDHAGFLHFCNLSATFDDAYQAGFENQQLPRFGAV